MAKFIALLRAVNVGGRTVKMAELRALCADLGWRDIESYIQSGNIVFAASGKPAALETALEKAIGLKFRFEVPVIIRSADELDSIVEANPFPEASQDEPGRVLVGLSKDQPRAGAAEAIQARGAASERVDKAGGALWFHYPEGVGTSKLTPSLIDRLVGSPLTARNWRTILKLQEMAQS